MTFRICLPLILCIGSCALPPSHGDGDFTDDPYRKNAGTLGTGRLQFLGDDGRVYGGNDEPIELARARYDLQKLSYALVEATKVSETRTGRAVAELLAGLPPARKLLTDKDPGVTGSAKALLRAMQVYPASVETADVEDAIATLESVVGRGNRQLAGIYFEMVKRHRSTGDTNKMLAAYKVADRPCRQAFGKSSEGYEGFLVTYLQDAKASGDTSLADKVMKKLEVVAGLRESERVAQEARQRESRQTPPPRNPSRYWGQTARDYATEAANEAAMRFEMQNAQFLGAIGGGFR